MGISYVLLPFNLDHRMQCFSISADGQYAEWPNLRRPAQPTAQQKAKGRRIISPVLLPLDKGDGI